VKIYSHAWLTVGNVSRVVGNVSPGGWDPREVNRDGKMVEGTDSGQDPRRRRPPPLVSQWFSKSYIQVGYLVLCVM
jgi:hypothetical protein